MLPTTTRPVNQDTCVNIDAPSLSVQFMIERIEAMLKMVPAERVEFVYWFLLHAPQ